MDENSSVKNNCKYTIVVSSCDAYEDLWIPFFRVLMDEWEGLDSIPIVLNTESKKFTFDGLNITTMQLYSNGQKVSWTRRLRETLKCIDTEYVLCLLDDFFMQGRVRTEVLEKHINWLECNKQVSMICYMETFPSKNILDGKLEGFERRPLFSEYKFNCQAAMWNRKRLISYLNVDENPWEWETLGNWRSYRHPFHVFYSAIPGGEYVFPYICRLNGIAYGGLAVYRGRWYVPCIDPILKKHGIEIDYMKRGIVTDEEFKKPEKPIRKKEDSLKWKQYIWFARPIYCKVKEICNAVGYFLSNIRHFF